MKSRPWSLFFFIGSSVLFGVFYYFRSTQYPYFPAREVWAGSVVFLSLFALLVASIYREKLAFASLIINFDVFLIAVLIFSAEGFLWVFPRVIPSVYLNMDPTIYREKSDILEHYPVSPWVKFKPNTRISILSGGGGLDFVNHWKTDQRGYKNLPEFSNCKKYIALAVGDSFVEGMGTATRDAWPSVVSRNEFPVYNLGVQGYAPVQSAGTLKRWIGEIKADLVLIGYTPGSEHREIHYLNAKEMKGYTGGIGQISRYLKENRGLHRYKVFPISNLTIDLAKQHAISWLDNFGYYYTASTTLASSNTRMGTYLPRILRARKIRFVSDRLELNLTQKRILDIRKMAQGNGMKVAIVYFTLMERAYYRAALGKEPDGTHFEIQTRNHLRDFSLRNGIDFIDTSEEVLDYMKKEVQKKDGAMKLPYFKGDGHFNRIGNGLVANVVIRYLRSRYAAVKSCL